MKIKLSEWEQDGYWHAADVSAVGQGSSTWWFIPRALNMSLVDYVEMVITKFKPDRVHYFEEVNLLYFTWKSQAAMRLYKNQINAMLRKAGAQ